MSALRYFRDAAVFAPCYLVLDWASYIVPLGPFNITPWNPQPALAIVWMLLGGLQHFPVVAATLFAADLLIRGAAAGYAVTLLTAVVLSAAYVAIAWALRTLPRFDTGLRTTRDLTQFAAITLAGTALGGAVFVGVLAASEPALAVGYLEAWLRFWTGDAVGVLVTAPLLLVVADRERRRELIALSRRAESWAQTTVLAGLLWLIFAGLPGDPALHFYLLFMPLIWVALRGGMAGAVVAAGAVQIGVVIGMHHLGVDWLPAIELQALVAALTLTGLYLGTITDERSRAAADLRQSLRLAAAGEMAGAIAHEVNQPLTALSNYGQAALELLARGGEAQSQVPAVLGKMLGEAERAADVVRRLRDFFRAGTTRLESLSGAELEAMLRTVARQVIGVRPVQLDVRMEPALPPLHVDRLQIELVLRNLIANATEALQAGGRVRVRAQRDGATHLRLVVEDEGPGISAESRERVFEPFVSGKPSGMGLGLAISRAIAEAHGGSLEARAAGHGEFHLVLPCQTAG
jgi:two-component system sensor kinase FixL